jgi:hypothetical protein
VDVVIMKRSRAQGGRFLLCSPRLLVDQAGRGFRVSEWGGSKRKMWV